MAKQPIETVDPRTLVPHPENPRRGDVAGVTRSIRDNGWWGVVIAQRSTGRILAGHTRTAAAIEAGLESVPVFWLDVDDDGARRVLLADNRWADVATYDPAGLAALLGFIGVREDLGVEPSHPKPLAHRLAVVDAVPTIQATIIATRSMNINPWIPATLPPGQPALDDRYGRLWPLVPIGKSAATVTGAKCGPEGKTPAGSMSCYKLDPSKPSPTLSKTQTGRGFATLVHPYEMRALSIDEAKIIGSFPRAFTLQGSYSDQWARIGNSVPPFMMRAIAEHLRDVILPATRKAPAEAGA